LGLLRAIGIKKGKMKKNLVGPFSLENLTGTSQEGARYIIRSKDRTNLYRASNLLRIPYASGVSWECEEGLSFKGAEGPIVWGSGQEMKGKELETRPLVRTSSVTQACSVKNSRLMPTHQKKWGLSVILTAGGHHINSLLGSISQKNTTGKKI